MKIYQVDAFSSKPFLGNPAGVCILENEISDILMQNIAMEMNLSETAFVYKHGNKFNLRWFTPEVEVDLCGHATLATAYILYNYGLLNENEKAIFETKSGLLYAQKEDDYITLDFPAEEESPTQIPEGLSEAIGAEIVYCGRNRMDLLIEVQNESVVKQLQPNITMLSKIYTNRGFIITARSKDFDFVSRFFAPSAGILEDPVTGSAHCCLAPFWSKKLKKSEFKAFQASKRGGELLLRLDGDRVFISGEAVITMECDLKI